MPKNCSKYAQPQQHQTATFQLNGIRQWLSKACIPALLALCVISPLACAAFSLPTDLAEVKFKSLKPMKSHKKTSSMVFNELYYRHYQSLPVNDQLSSRVFDQFLQQLDPQRYYFLASDIAEFEQYRFLLDEALETSNLEPGFKIFNRYQERVIERLVFALDFIEKKLPTLTFKGDDTIEIDRENSAWAQSIEESNALWRKRLTNAALTQKLDNATPEKILKNLNRRYRSKLQRILQTNSEDAFEPYINAFAQIYDPHTQYLSPRNSENFNINMRLSLEGIGAVLQKEDEYTKVVRLVPAGPADKSNLLKPADRIVGVGQGRTGEIEDVIGFRIDEVVDRIRGPKGTTVALEIIPSTAESDHQTKVIHIKRDLVKLEDQAAKSDIINIKRPDNSPLKIGVIDIPAFYVDFAALRRGDEDYRSTTRDVKALITELQQKDIDGLVVDLRNNGGGSLREANQLLGLFIRKGPTVQVRDNKGKVEVLKDKDRDIFYDGPMAVLVNRLSASASEIFAAAIQDYERGLVVGTQTFGKGTVQALRDLDEGQLKITQAKFYRVSGKSSQHQGVLPDIRFPSLHDLDEIGESALDNALPWDSISPVKYDRYFKIQPTLTTLQKQHQARVATNPAYQYLVRTLELNEQWDKKNKLSLNEVVRLQERETRRQQQLELLNARRTAMGEAPLKSWPEEDDNLDLRQLLGEDHAEERSIEEDVLLMETSEILSDFILLPKNRVAKQL
jgi:carboxyl-terminal processing protease